MNMKSFLIRDILSSSEEASNNIINNNNSSSTINNNNNNNKNETTANRLNLNNPLDALFQMTSSTFVDALKRKDRHSDHHHHHQGSSNNFSSNKTSKKKRKSRTAFTNSQIFELERRFRIQKYLSPTDRDEIAMTLNLSNAQVITWFQNRRAKLKRDLEEQKRDIETATLISLHNTLVAYSQMKATAMKTNEPIYGTAPGNDMATPENIDVEEDDDMEDDDEDEDNDDTTPINPV